MTTLGIALAARGSNTPFPRPATWPGAEVLEVEGAARHQCIDRILITSDQGLRCRGVLAKQCCKTKC